MRQERIVIVEDEAKIAEILIEYLHSFGYETQYFERGAQVVSWLKENRADCVILDIMLPDSDGIELCQQIRGFSQIPIMMLTARVEEVDRILGLEMGADDYICKPFSPREVVARVKALLRRAKPSSEHPQDNAWVLDGERYQVRYQGDKVDLSAVEFEILRTLSQAPGRIFSRAQLIDSIYHDHRIVSDRTIDSHIKKLRQKLSAALGENDWIQSVYGVGYKFAANAFAESESASGA